MSSIFIFLARQVRKSLLFFSPLFRTEKFKVFSVKIISQTLILHVVIFIFFTFPKEWNCLFIAESTLALLLCHFLYCLSGAVPVLGFVCTGYFLFLYLCHLIMLRLLVRLIQSVSSYSIFGSGITQRDLIWEALTYMRLTWDLSSLPLFSVTWNNNICSAQHQWAWLFRSPDPETLLIPWSVWANSDSLRNTCFTFSGFAPG